MDMTTVGFALLLVIGVVMTLILLRRTMQGLASKGWPSTPGIVRSSGVSTRYDEDGTMHKANIVYEYVAGGARQFGERRSFSDYRSSSGLLAHRIVARYPVGTQVRVYYHPRKPELSVLEPGINWTAPLFIAGGLILSVVGLVGLLRSLG